MVEKRVIFGFLSIPCRSTWLVWLPLCLLVVTQPPAVAAEKPPVRLLDQKPFDRITLDVASGSEVIDTLLLDLPNRRLPDPFPASGALQLRRLSEPSALYNLPWTSIAKIELFEQLLLDEATKLADARDLVQAYEYLNFLHKNYPQLAGLKLATEKYLRQDALASYANKNHEETLTILLSLYDLNPQHRGLKRFVETVTDQLIADHLSTRDFGSARSVLDLLSKGFPQLGLTNVDTWQAKFEKGAARQLSLARRAIDAQRYVEARQALRRALAILPTTRGANEMLDEIDRKSPQVVVAVDQLVTGPSVSNTTLEWSNARVAQLTQPKLLNLIGFGAEGGDYDCPWANIASDDTGLQLDVQLNPAALRRGISAEVLALELLKQADSTQPQFRADFAGLLSNVKIGGGNLVSLQLQRSHVRPEALLPLALQNITQSATPPGAYQASLDQESKQFATYQLPQEDEQTRGPTTVIEQFYDDEEAALADLLSGEVDVLARVPSWQVARLQKTNGIVISPYRLPTIHVLLPNYKQPIMGRREFRRALCYGVNRPQILNDILLGGENRAGYRVLSGPLPAGVTLTDPVGYAYDQGRQPRTYEPRLAAVLATVARNSLAKKAAAMKEAAGESETANEEPADTPPVKPLVLAHPPNPVATTVCQSLKLQLSAVGIPITLKRLAAEVDGTAMDYDLRYAELALWEPIVDARRLLGPHGLAGNCSSSMSLALQDVDQAKNWKEARSRLQEVHRIAFNDLPVIPLWQTVDFFAYRQALSGVGNTPVTLYQNITDWKRASLGASR